MTGKVVDKGAEIMMKLDQVQNHVQEKTESEGFEPSNQLPSCILSKDVHSATLPTLHKI